MRDGASGDVRARWSWVLVAAVVAGTALLRCRLLSVPLERDEGEYAYMGQLILRGDVPYLAAHNMKLPGVYYVNAAVLWLLGETDVAVRLGLLAANLAAVVLIYRIGRRLFDATAGIGAAATYAILSLSPGVLGFTANAEHFVVLPMLGAVLLLARLETASSLGRVASAGVLLGLAYVMKQQGAAFVVFGAAWVLVAARRRSAAPRQVAVDACVFGAATTTPFLLTCAVMARSGALDAFWFWTVRYAGEYVSMIPLRTGLGRLVEQSRYVVGSATALWALAALGAVALAADRDGRRHATFVALWTICSFAAVCPGLRFSEHYFILLLPAASVLAGVTVRGVARAARTPLAGVALIGVAVVAAVVQDRAVLLDLAPAGVSRAIYGANPFPEAVEIGRWLRDHTGPDERIAVIGSEPEIYFYARRRAATSYIYTYPLMEPHPFAHEMQRDMIAQLERARAPIVVMVNVDTSWSRRPESASLLFDWAERTLNSDYEPIGLVEILPDRPSVARWGEAARDASPSSPAFVATFRRRS